MQLCSSGFMRAWRGVLVAGLLVWQAASWAQSAPANSDNVKEISLANDRFSRGTPSPSWVDTLATIPTTQRKDPAVARLADTQFYVSDTPTVHVRRVWAINSASVLDDLGHVQVVFRSSYQRANLHALRVLRDGKTFDQTLTAKVRYLQREEGLEQGIYNGNVTASILVEDLRVGDSLEMIYSVEGANPVMGGKYVDDASWDNTTPTELRRVSLTHPVARRIQWRMYGDLNTQVPTPQETVSNGLRKLVWQEKSLAAVQYDANVPNTFEAERYLGFSEYQSWGEVAAWASELFRNQQPLPAELKQVVERINQKTTPEDKVSAALSWVQSEIRYFSVSLGESSHRPHQPSETLAKRYGDCKDKAFMLVELLHAMAIEAQPVLVNSRTATNLNKLMPTPYAFNHAIVQAKVSGQTYFIDPTRLGQAGKLEAIGQGLEGHQVLVVEPQTQNLSVIKTPHYDKLTRDELREKISIAKFGGQPVMEVRHLWSGVDAETRRINFAGRTKEELEKRLMESYERRYPGISRVADTVIEDDPINNLLTSVSRYTSPKMAIQTRGDWIVNYSTTNMYSMLPLPPAASRTQPMSIGGAAARTSFYSIDVEFPPEVAAVRDPYSRTVRDAAFEYNINTSFRGNRASTVITTRLLSPQVDVKNTGTYIEALRKVDDADRGRVFVSSDEIKSSGFLGLGTQSLQQTIKKRVEERIAIVGKAIDSGRLTGEDLAQAYCDRGLALSDSGNISDAMKDIQLAIKTAPNLASVYVCRADLLFVLKEYPKSIADYTQAITLGDTSSHTVYHRGQSRFYNNQLTSALDDFTKAVNPKNSDADAILYAELWRVWTQKRLGQNPDAIQLQQAKANQNGEWPRPALALLHGIISVDDVLKQVNRKQGDDKTLALTEAYFYIGQHYLALGDKAQAKTYFQKTREQGISFYVEDLGASIELERLAAGQ
jgi:lipoprotein NlpI/transglutaminase-like putative cysteine protease